MKLPLALLLLSAAPAALAQCPLQIGVAEAAPPIDGWSTIRPLGFAFPWNGTTYTDFFYSDHGVIQLTNGGTPVASPGLSHLWDPGSQPNTSGQGGLGFPGFTGPTICAYWGDHTFNAGTAWIDNTSGTSCTITWFNSEPYFFFTAGQFTSQITLYADGSFIINTDARCNNTSSSFGALTTVIGANDPTVAIPPESDLSSGVVVSASQTCFEEFTGPGPAFSNTPDPNFDLASTTLTFLPTNPGWIVTVTPLICGTATAVGTGCGGLSLTETSPAVLGTLRGLQLTGVPVDGIPNFLAIGQSIAPAPIGLLFPTLFDASCSAYQDLASGLFNFPAATGGIANGGFSLPRTASLAGATLTIQGMSFNTFGSPTTFVLSNGIDTTVGF